MFPTLTPRIVDLYGASGSAYRVGEAEAYAQDLDELEREEKALENMVQELVNRRAPVPIGVKFHRERVENTTQQEVAARSKGIQGGELCQDREASFVRSSSSDGEGDEEEEEEGGEAMDEDELVNEDDEEEEEETTARRTIVRGEGPQRGEDSFARVLFESGDDSMELEEPVRPSGWN
uniref:Uncharacterized protein n=1 Tax=Peronospora matthiolae TaxID=2874970 RepID=A0AAV1UN67_9STRA